MAKVDDGADWLCKRWRAPPVSSIKINTDGSFREEDGIMGGGGLLRDNNGAWRGGFMWCGLGGDLFTAEATTL